MIRKISAHYVFTGTGEVLKYGIVHITDDGIIADVINTHGLIKESEKLEFYSGMIIPGFVSIDNSLNQSEFIWVTPAESVEDIIKSQFDSWYKKHIIITDPFSLNDKVVKQLLLLEKNGTNIVLHFSKISGNKQPSVFENIRELLKTSEISLFDILRWTTINPARAMKTDLKSGSIEINKQPGLNQITGLDYEIFKLSANSSVRVIA